eukprot:CAMPEP_0168229446 /NCGR_PEP_ID=MMETSP0140_2-20121125/15280_1 /TAXON_ID=44445 /ORGANISM="Pseudo-nitzschia australis, Strain 10249 10 AB" /LENGTH=159 /DNA_ID=CAMNT_0008161259 /DNA_START=385 /DNA_END=861 /DNA_ORIENTATION=-
MILKEDNNLRIHRLRVIHIVEADLNFLLGAKWWTAVHKARKDNTLHCRQYEGCPGQQAQTIPLMEELQRYYSLLTRTPYTNFDSDCASAYDRVLVSVSSLASRSFGIHRRAPDSAFFNTSATTHDTDQSEPGAPENSSHQRIFCFQGYSPFYFWGKANQ